ncbi:MAG: DUF6952 family protein [Bacteroidota bacterium]
MKLPIIKKLVETYSVEQLMAAEASIAEGNTPAIEIEGEDEGEQLTHAFAAMSIKQDMEQNGKDLKTALRDYTNRVRECLN